MRKQIADIDDQLIEGFSKGYEKSFTEVYNLLHPVLFQYCHKIMGDQFAAEDLVEESFLKVWDRRTMFGKFSALKAYLYTTVRNASLSWLRKKNSQEAAVRNGLMAKDDSEKTVLENLIEAETMKRIYAEVDNLPPRSRQVMTMLFIEGRKTKDIAKELQISINTVQAHKLSGLAFLRRNLRTV